MRNSRLFLAVLFAASALSARLRFPWTTTSGSRSPWGEFRIFSSASERATVEMVTELLRMRETIGKVAQLKVRWSLPMHILVFKNERTSASFRDALFQRRNANAYGGFLSEENANFVIQRNDTRGGVGRVVHDELTHYFVENTLTGLPQLSGPVETSCRSAPAGDELHRRGGSSQARARRSFAGSQCNSWESSGGNQLHVEKAPAFLVA